jgi:hypothetical protein
MSNRTALDTAKRQLNEVSVFWVKDTHAQQALDGLRQTVASLIYYIEHHPVLAVDDRIMEAQDGGVEPR